MDFSRDDITNQQEKELDHIPPTHDAEEVPEPLSAQRAISETMTPMPPIKAAIQRAIGALRCILACDYLWVLIIDEEQETLKTLNYTGSDEPIENIGKDIRFDLKRGLLGWVIEHRRTLRVNDVTNDPRCDQPSLDVRAVLAAPICNQEHVIAVIYLGSRHRDAFSEADEKLATWAAQQLSVTVENAHLRREMERRLEEVATLHRLAQQIDVSLNVQAVLTSIVQSLQQAMQCRGCSIALLDAERAVLEIRASAGLDEQWAQAFTLRLGEGIAGKVVQNGVPIYEPDVLTCESFVPFDPAVRSLLTVPMMLQKRVIGALSVDSDQTHAFNKMDERFLTIAAAQAAVAIEKARLYASLEQRAQNLAEAYAELKRADRLKGEIVRNVSHELRTPLTFVKSYVDLLMEENAGPLNDAQRQYLTIISEKTERVTRLVNDIVSFDQADRAPCRREPLSLTNLLKERIAQWSPLAMQKGLTLVDVWRDDTPLALGDQDKLAQAIDHLLKNAIKFSPEGGCITIAVEETETMLQVAISDEGIGIPHDQHTHIFERFYQIDGSARRRFGGAGLGLAIVKRIVEAHEGHIWVESKPGHGSTFYFVIPKFQPATEVTQVSDLDQR